jgi:hypothetical protein
MSAFKSSYAIRGEGGWSRRRDSSALSTLPESEPQLRRQSLAARSDSQGMYSVLDMSGLLTLAPPSGPMVKSTLLCEHLGACWLVQLMQGLVATGASNAPKPKDLLTGQSQASYNHYYSVM